MDNSKGNNAAPNGVSHSDFLKEFIYLRGVQKEYQRKYDYLWRQYRNYANLNESIDVIGEFCDEFCADDPAIHKLIEELKTHTRYFQLAGKHNLDELCDEYHAIFDEFPTATSQEKTYAPIFLP